MKWIAKNEYELENFVLSLVHSQKMSGATQHSTFVRNAAIGRNREGNETTLVAKAEAELVENQLLFQYTCRHGQHIW